MHYTQKQRRKKGKGEGPMTSSICFTLSAISTYMCVLVCTSIIFV